uniref:Uncharacterized protein n=1 Tax=Ursus maritimus TaxID=29073 RepID=A0A452VCJ9_URSMA
IPLLAFIDNQYKICPSVDDLHFFFVEVQPKRSFLFSDRYLKANKLQTQTKRVLGFLFFSFFFFFFKDFIYLFDRDRDSQREREHKQGEWERKKQAHSGGT